jgi:outer membrane protein assembly factor BamB
MLPTRTVLPGAALLVVILAPLTGFAADQPQWGQRDSRNMVSNETGLPDGFDPGTRNQKTGEIDLPPGGNVKWVARLGDQSYGSPVVAGGRVLVGTNNEAPRDPSIQGDRGVLMCFDEKTGKFLWQLVVPKRDDNDIKWSDWRYIGLTSPPTVEGDCAYLVSNRCEVLCLDVRGKSSVLWRLDMPNELGVRPHNGSNCSILIRGNLLYICTSNGVDWTHNQVANPKAPSVIVLNKQTGKLVARDQFGIGADIIHGQWSSLALGAVGSRTLLFFGAGNGWLYAFDALDSAGPSADGSPRLLRDAWRINGHPLAQTQDRTPIEHCHDTHSYEVTASPVFYKNRVYVVFTQEPFHGMKDGWLTCLDATRSGDITRSGIVWSYKPIAASISTVAIHDGLVYAAGFDGRLHCLDAETGRCYWVHDAGKPIWGSPLAADGKVYLGTGAQVLWVLAADKELKVINRVRMRDGVFTTPTAANGTLFVATNKHLYAVGKKKEGLGIGD